MRKAFNIVIGSLFTREAVERLACIAVRDEAGCRSFQAFKWFGRTKLEMEQEKAKEIEEGRKAEESSGCWPGQGWDDRESSSWYGSWILEARQEQRLGRKDWRDLVCHVKQRPSRCQCNKPLKRRRPHLDRSCKSCGCSSNEVAVAAGQGHQRGLGHGDHRCRA